MFRVFEKIQSCIPRYYLSEAIYTRVKCIKIKHILLHLRIMNSLFNPNGLAFYSVSTVKKNGSRTSEELRLKTVPVIPAAGGSFQTRGRKVWTAEDTASSDFQTNISTYFKRSTSVLGVSKGVLTTRFYQRGVKKINPADKPFATSQFKIFQELLPLATITMKKAIANSPNRNTLKIKPLQIDTPFDPESIIFKIEQMIDLGEFKDKDTMKLKNALRLVRDMRLDFSKLDVVNLLQNGQVYISALILTHGPGMLDNIIMVQKATRYLEEARMSIIDPLPN